MRHRRGQLCPLFIERSAAFIRSRPPYCATSLDLLSTDVVPEHARDLKRDAREFAAEHIAPNAEKHFRTGDYPWEILEAGMDAGLVAQDIGEKYGGRGLDLAAAALAEAWAFVHEREEFGRHVADFQAVQHGLADMRLEFEAARALNYRAARNVEEHDEPGLWATVAKTKSTAVATANAEQGMQFHGGRSILSDRRIARVYRDVPIPVIYEGANEIQRNLIYRQSGEQ